MSKFRNRLMKRVMAVILSGAMVMSSMTSYAAEVSYSTGDAYAEAASEAGEPEVNEAETKEAEKADDENAADKSTADAAVEEQPDASSEVTEATETAAETATQTEPETESAASTETAKPETETTEAAPSTEAPVESDTEMTSEEETVEEASETEEMTETESETETETVEEETTEESEDNAEAGVTNFEIKENLVMGQEYGDDILKFSVLDNMSLKTSKTPIVVGENSYANYVVGNDNPTAAGGSGVKEGKDLIPVKGAAFKIQPIKNVRITFVVSGAGSDTSAKYYYFVEDDGETGKKIKSSSPDNSFPSGAYDCDLEAGKTYYFFVNGSKVNVYHIRWRDKDANRPAWADVAKPVIKAALSETDKEKIQVTVDAAIGNDADKLTVYMYNKKGDEVDKQESVKEQNQTTFEFEPEVSGEYTFTAELSRDKEETTIVSEPTAPVACEVAMKFKWNFTSYGNGMSAGKDTQVGTIEEGITITSSKGKIVPNSNDGLSFYYTSINPNDLNFTFTVNAHVDKWKYTNGQEGFGIMVSDSVGDITSNDPVKSSARFWNNSYQAVISKISYKWNGVEVSEDNSGEAIDMQIGVGATEKVGVTPQDVQAIIIDNTAQQPTRYKAEQHAIDTTYAKYGKGQYNMVKNWENDEAPIGSDKEVYEDFWLQLEKNNTGYAVRYAKYEVNEDGSYKLDENGKKIVNESTIATKQFYDTEALSILEKNKIYIGMFAARNATITFSDIDLKTWPVTEDDTPREPKPVKYINLSNSILSGGLTNTPDYSFMFASNWSGTFRLKDSSGKYFTYTDEQGTEKDTWEVKGTLDPEVQYCQDGDNAKDTKVRIEIDNLSVGKNDFIVEYTPRQDWTPEWDKYFENRKVIELRSYNMVEVPFSVEYKKYGQEGQTIYVSQDGKTTNIGTKESPLDIYTAVKYAQPGQTILLNGGRYSLNRTLQITKGINGEPDIGEDGKETYNRYIKMMGDPADEERPVLDFNGTVAAVVAVGNYWYFKDFDVIRCKDGEKGIQVSGSWCVYDRVDTYRNGSTGLQICRAASTDTYRDWPHDNLILNCNSYLNVDKGQEDADGFAAKLTSGSNNVFDGCIAAFNADDGWDLFAKAQTGSIGGVIIKNSIAYRNGYLLKSVKDGTIKTPAEAAAEGDTVRCVKGDGNGNGFKMGGDGLPAGSQYDEGYGKDPDSDIPNIGHRLYNSLSFGNKSKGIDSNSAPNIKAYNSVSFNNDGANISLYTYSTNKNTDYELQNVVSFRTGTDPTRVEPDVREFPAVEAENIAQYKSTHSLNFMGAAEPGNKSSAIYFSLKNAKSMEARVKVWWRSSDPEFDEMMIMSEKGEAIGREYPKDPKDTENRRISEENGLIVSKLYAKGTEKCYLGVKNSAVSIYKAEITVQVKDDKGEWVEKTYVVDISDRPEYNQYTEIKSLTGTDNKVSDDKLVEIRIYYRAISSDSVDSIGAQNKDKINNATVFKWDAAKDASLNNENKEIVASDFDSLEYPYFNTVSPDDWRNADGTIKTEGFLKLKPGAGQGAYTDDKLPSIGGTGSAESDKLIGEDTDGTISSGNAGEVTPGGPTDSDYGEDYPGDIAIKDENGNYVYFRKIWAADIKYVDYTDKEEILYTGKAITPEVHVRYSGNSELLRKGKDYRLKYENNINAGEATVYITGAGNYAGYDNVKTFTIKKISLKDETVFVPSHVAAAAGKDVRKEIKPTWLGKALKEGKDYTIENDPEDPNKLIVKAVEGGNFEDSVPVTVVKDVPADKLMSKASVKITTPAAQLVYNQSTGVEPKCEVKLAGKLLVEGTDYEVKYANHKDIGKATLSVVGKNDGTNGYFGSKSINYTIKGGNLKDAEIFFGDEKTTLEQYVATLDGKTFNGSSYEVPVGRVKVRFPAGQEGKTLKNGTDYTIVQKGTDKAGTATVTIKGINGYTGTQVFKFKILPLEISTLPDSVFSFSKVNEYKVGGVKLDTSFKITIDGIGVNPKNYSLSYKNNNIVAKPGDPKEPTLIVSGRNGLKGKKEFTFTINPSPMAEDRGISVSAKDIAANGKDLKYSDLKRATISVTQIVGTKTKRLVAGRDYNKDVKYYIDVNQNYQIDEPREGEEGEEGDMLIDITSKDLITNHELFKKNGYITVLVRIEAAKDNAKCYYGDGYVDSYFRVGTTDINKAKIIYIDGQNRVFGQEINESDGTRLDSNWDTVRADIDKYIAVTLDTKYNPNKNPSNPNKGMTLDERKKSGKEIMWIRKAETEYLVRPNILETEGFVIVPNSYKKNNKVGTASFIIRGTGKYAGTKRVTFKILSKQQSDKLAEKINK